MESRVGGVRGRGLFVICESTARNEGDDAKIQDGLRGSVRWDEGIAQRFARTSIEELAEAGELLSTTSFDAREIAACGIHPCSARSL